ncbi:hypothetical protein H0H87_003446 [Tephrocybe sp. NHM501043]|nr:hypothetical protein H0H87_003446 [Tephrocybe sp. NHM501043]
MLNARSRLHLASVVGFTCAAVAAVWIYTKSRPLRKEDSKSNSETTAVPSVDQANGDVALGTAEASAGADSQVMPNAVPQAMSTAAPPVALSAAQATAVVAAAFQVGLAAAIVPPQAPPAAQVTPVMAPVAAPVAPAVVAAPISSPAEAAHQLIAGQTVYSRRQSKREPALQLVNIKFDSSLIELALQSFPMGRARENYETMATRLDKSPEAAFQISGRIHQGVNWSSTNLQKLAAGFQWLRNRDEQLQRCRTLIVELPTAGNILPHNNPENTALFLPAVTNLTWTSHRNQLPLMFCPTQIPHAHLTSLTLNCNLSIPDCASVLREFATTLVKFKVTRLIGLDNDPDNVSVLPQNAAIAPAHMLALDTLDIDSEFSPGSMLDEFHFENLKAFKLKTSYSKLAFFQGTGFNSIIWEKLETTTIHGDYDDEESEHIKHKKCPGRQHNHHHEIMLTMI